MRTNEMDAKSKRNGSLKGVQGDFAGGVSCCQSGASSVVLTGKAHNIEVTITTKVLRQRLFVLDKQPGLLAPLAHPLAKELHDVLELGRKELGLGKTVFTQKLGLKSTNAYANWEKGKNHPDRSFALAGLEVIGYSYDDADLFLENLHKKHNVTYIRHDGRRERSKNTDDPALNKLDEDSVETDSDGQDETTEMFEHKVPKGLGIRQFAKWAVVAACLVGPVAALTAAIVNRPDKDLAPTALAGLTLRGECVPHAGNVRIEFGSSSAQSTVDLACANGWANSNVPARLAPEVRAMTQAIGSGQSLEFDFASQTSHSDTDGVFVARRSPSYVLWARRTVYIKRACVPDALRMVVKIRNIEHKVECDARGPKQIVLLGAEDMIANIEFWDDAAIVHSCSAFFSLDLDGPIDLSDGNACSDEEALGVPSKQVPLLPFWNTLHTFEDTETGNLWMRDLFRYGPARSWGSTPALDQILLRVRNDTKNPNWEIATQSEISALTDFVYFRSGRNDDGLEILSGIARDSDDECPGTPVMRFTAYPTVEAPLSDTNFDNLRCNFSAGDHGIWLILRRN